MSQQAPNACHCGHCGRPFRNPRRAMQHIWDMAEKDGHPSRQDLIDLTRNPEYRAYLRARHAREMAATAAHERRAAQAQRRLEIQACRRILAGTT